jgi:hypothetical protein
VVDHVEKIPTANSPRLPIAQRAFIDLPAQLEPPFAVNSPASLTLYTGSGHQIVALPESCLPLGSVTPDALLWPSAHAKSVGDSTARCTGIFRQEGPICASVGQFSVGRSACSITNISIEPFAGRRRRPSCSLSAVKIEGPVSECPSIA